MMDWLAMGGYAFYVWCSFGLSLIVLVGNLWLAKQRHDRVLDSLQAGETRSSAQEAGSFREVTP